VVVTMLGALFASSSQVGAQGAEITIQAQVKEQQRDENGRPDNQPIAGVTITVLDAAGVEIGTAVTDDKGIALIPIPAKADYTVRLDESTLPDGQAIGAESAAEQAVTGDSFTTNKRIVNFFTGESQRTSQSSLDRISQRFADGIRFGLIIAMCSVGLSLIFGTTGLTNFAHGELVTFGGMMAYWFNVAGIAGLGFLSFLPGVDDSGRFHVIWATVIATILGGVFGYCLDRFGFGWFRRKGVGLISQMVITVGLAIVLKNLFLFFFGGRRKPYRQFALQEGMQIGPIVITPRDLIVTILSTVVLVAVAMTLQYSRLGKATRAVADSPDLASATGINSQAIIRIIWVAGGALAALGGVFRGLDEQVGFDMGTQLLFLMFAGITLGGLGSAYGALVGGFVVGILVEVSTLVGVPTELKTTPALLILILVLLFRPQGILGRAQRVG
jgi:branched-chain amino acid transport system permease protein